MYCDILPHTVFSLLRRKTTWRWLCHKIKWSVSVYVLVWDCVCNWLPEPLRVEGHQWQFHYRTPECSVRVSLFTVSLPCDNKGSNATHNISSVCVMCGETQFINLVKKDLTLTNPFQQEYFSLRNASGRNNMPTDFDVDMKICGLLPAAVERGVEEEKLRLGFLWLMESCLNRPWNTRSGGKSGTPAVKQQAANCLSQVISTAVKEEGGIRTEMHGQEGTEVRRPRRETISEK